MEIHQMTAVHPTFHASSVAAQLRQPSNHDHSNTLAWMLRCHPKMIQVLHSSTIGSTTEIAIRRAVQSQSAKKQGNHVLVHSNGQLTIDPRWNHGSLPLEITQLASADPFIVINAIRPWTLLLSVEYRVEASDAWLQELAEIAHTAGVLLHVHAHLQNRVPVRLPDFATVAMDFLTIDWCDTASEQPDQPTLAFGYVVRRSH
jgi:hypothetical protein